MKGIVLAGGTGSRLAPSTRAVCKQLLPLYDKPMIYYPVATLMSAGIRDILIITTPTDQGAFIRLLGDGSRFGVAFTYTVQFAPNGGAEAFALGADFVGLDSVALILGDNVFHGAHLGDQLKCRTDPYGGVAFVATVPDPERYGVVTFNSYGAPVAIDEKPTKPTSSYALTGLYFYDNEVFDIAAEVAPSARGELEITDVNKIYLAQGRLIVETLGRGTVWFDTGTFESMMSAAQFVQAVRKRQGLQVGCLEEVAWREGFIDDSQLACLARDRAINGYGDYLSRLIEQKQSITEVDHILVHHRTSRQARRRSGWFSTERLE